MMDMTLAQASRKSGDSNTMPETGHALGSNQAHGHP